MITVTKALLDRRFYFAMTALIAAVVVYGFVPRLDERLLHPSHPVPAALYAHTLVFSAWIILLLIQSGFVQAGRIALHRKLGIASAVFGATLPFFAVWVAIAMAQSRIARGEVGRESFLLIPFSDTLFFSVFFALALWWRKRPELHRRLILIASITLTAAAFARFPRFLVPAGWFYAACDVMILIAVVRDLIVDGRVHRVYLIGLPLLVLGQITAEWARHTTGWLSIASFILR